MRNTTIRIQIIRLNAWTKKKCILHYINVVPFIDRPQTKKKTVTMCVRRHSCIYIMRYYNMYKSDVPAAI